MDARGSIETSIICWTARGQGSEKSREGELIIYGLHSPDAAAHQNGD
jgi:hypothetical protein